MLISHADLDHQGGSSRAQRLFPNALFMCHVLDQPLVESTDRLITHRYGQFHTRHGIDESAETKEWIRKVCRSAAMDLALNGEAKVRLGSDWLVEILHTPGHSRGHVSIWDERSATAIIADAALGRYLPTADGQPAFPPTYREVDEYRSTIRGLRDLAPANLLTSHYPLLTGTAVDTFLKEGLEFADQIEKTLKEELASSDEPVSAKGLIERLSPRLGEWPSATKFSLAYPLLGHLERLEAAGVLRRDDTAAVARWKLAINA